MTAAPDRDDIVERLRTASGQMYVNELRSDAADAGIYRSWKAAADEAADEIERLRARFDRIRLALTSTDPEWTLDAIRRELEEKQ